MKRSAGFSLYVLFLLGCLLLTLSIFYIPEEAYGREKLNVCVVGTGRVAREDLVIVEGGIREYFSGYVTVRVLDEYMASPRADDSSYRFSHRFRTSQAFTGDYFRQGRVFMESLKEVADIDVLVIVTDLHLYTDNASDYVLGEALMEDRDRVCVLSTWYLKNIQSKEGNVSDQETYSRRLWEVAAHETGHTLGLSHVPDPRCLMFYGPRLNGIDATQAVLCRDSARRLMNTVPTYQCSQEEDGLKVIDHLPPLGCYLKSAGREIILFVLLVLLLICVRFGLWMMEERGETGR